MWTIPIGSGKCGPRRNRGDWRRASVLAKHARPGARKQSQDVRALGRSMKQNARKYAPGLTPPGSATIFVGTRPACAARPSGKSVAACGEIGVDSTDIAAQVVNCLLRFRSPAK